MHRLETAAPSPQSKSSKFRPHRLVHAEKTHCAKGHQYSPENTYITRNGWRQCRTCKNERDKARAKKPARRDKMRARILSWKARNPEKVSVARKKHLDAHPGYMREYCKTHPRKNPPDLVAARIRSSEWRRANSEWVRVQGHWRRARERDAKGHCTCEQWLARLAFHGWRCRYCEATGKMTIDHMIPLSRNGTNWPANMVPACMSCNARKHDKTFVEFYRKS